MPGYRRIPVNIPGPEGLTTTWEFKTPGDPNGRYSELCHVEGDERRFMIADYSDEDDLNPEKQVTADQCCFLSDIGEDLEAFRVEIGARFISLIYLPGGDSDVLISHTVPYETPDEVSNKLEALLTQHFGFAVVMQAPFIETGLLTMETVEQAERMING